MKFLCPRNLAVFFLFISSLLVNSGATIAQESTEQNTGAADSKSKAESTAPSKSSKKAEKKGKAKSNSTPKKTSAAISSEDGNESTPTEEGDEKKTKVTKKFKKVGVGLNAGYVYINGGGGFEGWFSPSQRLDLSLRVLGASAKMAAKGDAGLLETADVTMVQVATDARFYLGKSFYILGGLGYNTFSGEYGVTVSTTKQEYLLPMKAKGLSLNFAIGNRWKWDSGFVLGFDWLGYSSFTGMSVKLGEPDSPEEKSVFDTFRVIPGGGEPAAKAKSLLTRNNIYALLMTIGFAF